MTARPSTIALLLAVGGAGVLLLATGSLPESHYAPAALGSVSVFFATARLLRELRRRDRWSLAAGAAGLGFLVGAALTLDPYRWSLGFAGAWLPVFVFFLAGIGRERLTFELARLEDACDDPSKRPAALARATSIRDDARKAALAVDPDGASQPLHPGDARAVYAFAAQVVAYAHALEQRFNEALASLDAVPRPWMPSAMRVLMQSNLVFWHLCTGAIDKAQETLGEIKEKDALPEARPIVRATRAAVLVRTGHAAEALEIVGEHDGDAGEPDMVRARYRMIRAHAFADQGNEAGARAELARIVDTAGELDELALWAPTKGPASALIDELLAQRNRSDGAGGATPRKPPDREPDVAAPSAS